mmetsp:Transcript_15089/g.31039  ORF Transcript_15089/g.31039 Transcript_15089/m.31039 type:complete len:92 (-) Transcript_15089:124-399(-)
MMSLCIITAGFSRVHPFFKSIFRSSTSTQGRHQKCAHSSAQIDGMMYGHGDSSSMPNANLISERFVLDTSQAQQHIPKQQKVAQSTLQEVM